jgi:3-isopropylmalate dehydratase small subunit
VVARSLARIFSRNVRNLGLPAVECPSLPVLDPGAEVEVDLEEWKLRVPGTALALDLIPLDPFWVAVLHAGGLVPFLGLSAEAAALNTPVIRRAPRKSE